MPAWIVITPDDLNDYQAAKIVSAARTKALADNQADPFTAVMPDVVEAMRDDIRAKNKVSATPNTVPAGLRKTAVLLIIEAMQPRLQFEISEDLRKLIDDAKDRMKRVADGKIPIAIPDDPEPTETVQVNAPTAHTIGNAPRRTTRDSMSRL